MTTEINGRRVEFRLVDPGEYPLLQQFVQSCPPLTVHNDWLYWIFSTYQQALCPIAVATDDHNEEIIGAVLAMTTTHPATVWLQQIGVVPAFRSIQLPNGRTIAEMLLIELGSAARRTGHTRVECSIAGDNKASLGLLSKWARNEEYSVIAVENAIVPEDELLYRVELTRDQPRSDSPT